MGGDLRRDDADAGGFGHDDHGDHVLKTLLQEDQVTVSRQRDVVEGLRGNLDDGSRSHLKRFDLQAFRKSRLRFDRLDQERRGLCSGLMLGSQPRRITMLFSRVLRFSPVEGVKTFSILSETVGVD